MFEQAFKNIDDALWKESGCTTELDYTEQTSWLLFLKYLDGLEQDKAAEAMLEGKTYSYILDATYRWESWAAPKDENGKLDHNKALTGDDLVDFVDRKLFPYLHGFKQRAIGPNTIEYKIGEIFGEIKNKIRSGYTKKQTPSGLDTEGVRELWFITWSWVQQLVLQLGRQRPSSLPCDHASGPWHASQPACRLQAWPLRPWLLP